MPKMRIFADNLYFRCTNCSNILTLHKTYTHELGKRYNDNVGNAFQEASAHGAKMLLLRSKLCPSYYLVIYFD